MTSFSDDFNRADSTDLGANWVEVSGDWSIVSNQLSPGSAGGTIILRAASSMSSNDNYAQAAIAATASVSHGVWCRGNSNISSGYLWRNDGTSWNLFSVVGGSFTLIGTYATAAVSGDVAKVQAVGSTVKAYVNGVERVSIVDTSVSAGVNVGIRSESSGSIRWDNFSAGDVFFGSVIDASAETETAQPLTVSKSTVLGLSEEFESAQLIVGSKSFSLVPAFETDLAQSMIGEKENTIGIAASIESAEPLVGTKSFTLAPAIETNTALPLTSPPGEEVPRVTQSILTSIKKILNIPESDTSFDVDILFHINSVFASLNQLGIGPEEGFMIEDAEAVWADFLGTDPRLNSVKTYVHLRVKVLFDPPQTSFLGDSLDKQIQKLEWLLNVQREGDAWTDPFQTAV